MQGQELGPLEIEINHLNRQLEECNSEAMALQKHWLNEQKELVKLTREREDQITSLDTLQKQIIIMQQRKLRLESWSLPEPSPQCSSLEGGKREWRVIDGKSCPRE